MDIYVKNTIFKDREDEYNKLCDFHNRKEELYKLKESIKNTPYVIEFTGTPRTGKTTLINNLYDFFNKKGFKVEILEEFTTSEKYKKEIKPKLKDKYKDVVNTEIPKYVLKQLEEAISNNPDIIIVDRSLFDRLIWIDRLYLKDGISDKGYENYKELYIPLINEKINIIIATYTDALTALKRDYNAHLSLEKRTFLNEDNVNEYNKSLLNMKELVLDNNININIFDTTNKNEREISFEVVDTILNDMKNYYLEKIKDGKELVKKK
ncbi:MAG: AAA family ATPase [Bacilli bacterium]|nr:AAA family ATPase [Bacilli bacterium]